MSDPEGAGEIPWNTPATTTPSSPEPLLTVGRDERPPRSGAAFFYALGSLGLGMVLAQTLLGAVVLLGWFMRWMQREVLRAWWKAGRFKQPDLSFADFLLQSESTRPQARRPRWFRAQFPTELKGGLGARTQGAMRNLLGSAWANLRLGFQAILNVWVLTIPGCLLWLFAWYDGWNNSFTKGYEQAFVGPITGVLGIALFIAAMLYVPLAQARHAATGDWRRFYDFKVVWKLVRREWLACVFLAGIYSLLTFPAMVLKSLPSVFTQIHADWSSLSPEEASSILKTYWLWSALYLVPAYGVLRWLAAKIYARGLVRAVQRGALAEDDLAGMEWEALQRLGLLIPSTAHAPAWWLRMLAWVGTRIGGAAAAFVSIALWFTLVAQIFTSEFFAYHPFVGWMNQPTIQLPWFHYMPGKPSAESDPGGQK